MYTKCKSPAVLAEAIYTDSAHQLVIGLHNITKDGCQSSASVAQMIISLLNYIWCNRPGFDSDF